jgi:UDP-2,3-diacylglucosamine pyrophosphatase LpxH
LTWGWRRGSAKRPDPERPLILVADPHWSDELVGLQAATRLHPDADWLFLGDVFDIWVGIPGMASDAQRSFLSWVRERRRAGRWVGLWMGNREFFLDSHSEIFDFMGEGVEGALEAENLAFEHGDLINARDWQYRLWNRISRSGPMWLLFRMMPGRLAAFIAAKLEKQMRTTNRAYKLVFPREAFRAAAKAHAPRVFITGHFHTREEEGNGIALPWAYEGAFMMWREGRIEALAGPAKSVEEPTFSSKTSP